MHKVTGYVEKDPETGLYIAIEEFVFLGRSMRLPLYRLPAQRSARQVCFRFLTVVFLLFLSYKTGTIFLPARRIGQRRRATRAPMPVLYSTTGSDIPSSFAFCAVSLQAINAFSADTFFPQPLGRY